MDSQKSPDIFTQGELVGFKDKICTISEIRASKLGYNTYVVTDIDSNFNYIAFKHQLTKSVKLPGMDEELIMSDQDLFELDILMEMEMDEFEEPRDDNGNNKENSKAAQTSRFLNLTEQQIDSIAEGRTSKHTKEQTRWGLKIFKGM